MARSFTFEVLPEHIQLLRNMYVRWDDCEFGAPAIDSKRPYGNSYVFGDIGEILGIEPEENEYGDKEFTDEQEAYMLELHTDTETVLQIMIDTGEMKPGVYVREEFERWTKQ